MRINEGATKTESMRKPDVGSWTGLIVDEGATGLGIVPTTVPVLDEEGNPTTDDKGNPVVDVTGYTIAPGYMAIVVKVPAEPVHFVNEVVNQHLWLNTKTVPLSGPNGRDIYLTKGRKLRGVFTLYETVDKRE